MAEIFELRDKPELKIILNESNIEIIDTSRAANCGVYLYKYITQLELIEEQTDWFITILSWLFDLFSGGAGGKYKNKPHLNFRYKNKRIKIWLADVYFKEVERIVKIINKKTNN